MNFVVARNPDLDSRLPYLVRLPIDGGLILKVRGTWPRTSRVFCARVDKGWPPEAEIIEDRYGNLLKHAYAPAGFLSDQLRLSEAE